MGGRADAVAVVAGLITRAHAAGQDRAGGPGTAQPGGGWILGAVHMSGTVRRWPLFLIAAPAAVAIWSGWVGLGELCGFGSSSRCRASARAAG